MKIKRDAFKQIIKECLVEILSEGLSFNNQIIEEKKNVVHKQKVDQESYKKEYSVNRSKQQSKISPAYESAVSTLAQQRPDYAHIFEDTARHTLQEQNSAEGISSLRNLRGGDEATNLVNASNPEDLFGEESANKWAELAFAPSINRKLA